MKHGNLSFETFREHVKKRSMWIGSNEIADHQIWVKDTSGIFHKSYISCSDALLKCFDEILVNAVDQYINSIECPANEGGPVTAIHINFDRSSGEISIMNTGKGIPIYKILDENPAVNGKYSVEGIITQEFSGSNFDDDKNRDRVTGGINGLGMKLINIRSKRFEIETIDCVNKLQYNQICANNMEIINPPVVKIFTNIGKSHTTVRFIPDYADLCQAQRGAQNPDWIKNCANMNGFADFIEYRIYQIAAFVTSINYRYSGIRRIEYTRKPEIFFNGSRIFISSLADFAKYFGIEHPIIISFEQSREEMDKLMREAKDPLKCGIRFPWYIAIGTSLGKYEHISILNGVSLEGGSHCDMIKNHIYNQLKPIVEKLMSGSNIKFSSTILENTLFMIDCKQIPIPSFVGQTKGSIKMGAAELNEMKRTFILPKKSLAQIWRAIKPMIELTLHEKEIIAEKKSRKKKMHIRKYTEAEKLGAGSLLFATEGDSANEPVQNVINAGKSKLDYRLCGTYIIQGIPLNALKHIRTMMIAGKERVWRHKNLQNNIGLQGLMRALNLEYDEDYYFGPPEEDPNLLNLSDEQIAALHERRKRGDVAFSKLNYGALVITTDQDIDGIGQICSLIIVFIMTFWPELIKRNFVRRFATPIIRVYSASSVLNFYSKEDYELWATRTFGGPDKIPKSHHPHYYKGLAGHSEEEWNEDIGPNLVKNIITITWDEACQVSMNLLYGRETAGRKEVLLTPVDRAYDQKLYKKQLIPCSDHFMIEAKKFQLEFMRRKLKSAVDGFIPAQRKAFCGARHMLRGGRTCKVYQLTGYVAQKMQYQHGDASMNACIIKMAQKFTGSNNIPPFLPRGDFGSRKNGRAISGSPRYIDLSYNHHAMDLVFPPEDDFLLDYEFEDGKQCEPTYYVPIIPYAIIETTTTVSAGWNISVWARDFAHVIIILRNMIAGTHDTSINTYLDEHPWLPKGMGITVGKLPSGSIICEICTGMYEVDDENDRITVTQLPLRMWSNNFRCSLLGLNPKTDEQLEDENGDILRKELVKKCVDRTANDKNHIIIQLEEGAIAQIEAEDSGYGNEHIDALTGYLGMAQQMQSALNMIKMDGSICEFSTYDDVMNYWFPLRRDLYKMRLERAQLLCKLRIMRYENELRFIEMDATGEICIDKLASAARTTILERAEFTKFNLERLEHPLFLKLAELEHEILLGDASYTYIDRITKGDASEEGIARIRAKLQAQRDELERLEGATWQSIWLAELDQLCRIVQNGMKTNWTFSKKKNIFRSYDVESKN